MRLYDYGDSGNGYKVRLLLALLARPYELVEKDIIAGETRTEEFLRLNPNGRIPLLELDDGRCLAESNAILFYLAAGTPYLPEDAYDCADVLRWMFFEQYSHEPYVATSRFILRHTDEDSPRRSELAARHVAGIQALEVMERHLSSNEFFAAGRYTIADMALFAYTHVADQGGFDLDVFPAVRSWLDRVSSQAGHRAM